MSTALALFLAFDSGAWFAGAVVAHYDRDQGGFFKCTGISALFALFAITWAVAA
jgi:hypothetical protein